MNNALADEPVKNFQNPGAGLVSVTIDVRTGCLADRFTPEDERALALFPKGTEPTDSSRTSKECRIKEDRVSVPDVFGFPVKQAMKILKDEGFDVERVEEESVTYPPGRVIGQTPAGGKKAPRGSVITLVVSIASTGGGGDSDVDDYTTVPNVLGLTQEEAVARLNEAGFEVTTFYEKESDRDKAKQRKNRVWKQNPGGGDTAKRGSKVRIWVNP